jgi:hypothetical protein
MVLVFCPGFSDLSECRREIVKGNFPTERVCKELGNLLKSNGVSYTCVIRWPNDA